MEPDRFGVDKVVLIDIVLVCNKLSQFFQQLIRSFSRRRCYAPTYRQFRNRYQSQAEALLVGGIYQDSCHQESSRQRDMGPGRCIVRWLSMRDDACL